jgi:hypothetical protein
MYIKRKMYYSFALTILITLCGNKVFSATQDNLKTPPRSGNKSVTGKEFSPPGINEFPFGDSPDRVLFETEKEDKSSIGHSLPQGDKRGSRSLVTRKGSVLENEEDLLPPRILNHAPLTSNQKTTRNSLTLNVFKASLEKVNPVDLTDPATAEQFVNTILHMISTLKEQKLSDRAIGIAFNETAEKFRDHDYFSIDRFERTLTAAQQKSINARLTYNWQKWYAYKLLSYFYKNEPITTEDENIIDASFRSDNIDRYESSEEYRDQIYTPGKLFQTNKYNSGQVIYATLEEKLDGFSAFMDSLG